MRHSENHRTERIGWLRAAVLGANDGIVSTASLVVGVAAAETSRGSILVALPLVATFLTPVAGIPWVVSVTSIGFLAFLGGISAHAGGAPVGKGVARVSLWGALAMAATAAIGMLFGVAA